MFHALTTDAADHSGLERKMNYAPLWKRLLAALYDLFPVAALVLVVGALVQAFVGETIAPGSLASRWLRLLLLLTVSAYYVGSWHRGGFTIGMRAWRLLVQSESGHRPTLNQALLRFVASLLAIAPLGLGLWSALFDPRRRMWHDRLSGTVVVVVPKAADPRPDPLTRL